MIIIILSSYPICSIKLSTFGFFFRIIVTMINFHANMYKISNLTHIVTIALIFVENSIDNIFKQTLMDLFNVPGYFHNNICFPSPWALGKVLFLLVDVDFFRNVCPHVE